MSEKDGPSIGSALPAHLLELGLGPARFSSSGSDLSKSSRAFLVSHLDDPLPLTSNVAPLTPLDGLQSGPNPEKKKGIFTSKGLFNHSLYVEDIDFVLDQKKYLAEASLHNVVAAQPLLEDSLAVPSMVGRYKVMDQVPQIGGSCHLFRGVDEASGESVFLRFSPDFTHAEEAARFLNDWYVTSGINPAPEGTLWTAPGAAQPRANPPNSEGRAPGTLPKNLPGILYPLDELLVDSKTPGGLQKSMAMVFPDLGLHSSDLYFSQKVREMLPDKTSLASGSVLSFPSEFSGSDALDRSSTRLAPDNADYVELANKVKQHSKPLSLVLEILGDLVEALKIVSSAHKRGICHNGIMSHTILVRSPRLASADDQQNVFVIGWDFSFSVAVEDPSSMFRNINHTNIEKLHHYMAPECIKSRSNAVDYRSDIYSFGVVMYELIVGCLPFRSDNLAQLQKMVLGQLPLPPKILGLQWISNDLNYVITKCLKKMPGDRYSSIDLLIEDLKIVMETYRNPTRKESGKLGFKEAIVPRTKELPLFYSSLSRKNNLDARQNAYDVFNATEDSKVMIIKGGPGVGKSTLMMEIGELARKKSNFVVQWKYDFADNAISKHASSVYAIHTIANQILASSEEDILEWRTIFTKEIDVDLSILFGAIPSLKTLLGPHYSAMKKTQLNILKVLPGSPTTEGGLLGDLFAEGIQNEKVTTAIDSRDMAFDDQELNTELKYLFVFKKIFSLVAKKGLTVLFQNFHNCPLDENLLIREFLEFSVKQPHSKVTLVASFTESALNSTAGAPPIQDELEKLAESLELPSHTVNIESLGYESFAGFVEKFAGNPRDPDMTRRLYDVCDGNLLSFHYLLRYIRLSTSEENVWAVLDKSIQDGLVPRSMRSIVSAYLDACLTPESLSIMKFAAASSINGYFSMSELMIVTGSTLKEISKLLQLCLDARVIIPTGIAYKVPFHLIASDDFVFEIDDSVVWEFATRSKFKFDHDAIRVFLITEMDKNKELKEIHRKCGLKIKKKIFKEGVINVTSYLLMAAHLFQSCDVAKPEEHRHYSEALIKGGRFAIATSNIALALRYFTGAMRFVHEDDTRRKFKVILTQIQCNYLLKNYEESVRLILLAEKSIAGNNLSLLHLKVCSLFNLKKYEEGMQLAILSVQTLGLEVSSDANEIRKIAARHFSQIPLSVNEIRSLKTLKIATNKQFILASSFIMDMINPTYILDMPDLRKALLCQLIQLMHRHGRYYSCAIPLLHLANFFLSPSEHMSTVKALELADVALDSVNRDKGVSTSVTKNINEAYLMLIGHFKGPSSKLLKSASLFDQHGQAKSGNYFMRKWSVANLMFMAVMRGWVSDRSTLKKVISLREGTEAETFALMKGIWHPKTSFEDHLKGLEAARGTMGPDVEFVAISNAVLKAASDQQLATACDLILNRGYAVLKKVPMSLLHVWFYFIAAICLVSCPTEEGKDERMKLAKTLGGYFKVWSTTFYGNFGSKLKLIDACIVSREPNYSELKILDLFEEAIEDAHRQQNWLGVALANRLCAKWIKRTSNSPTRMTKYAQAAYALYSTINAQSQADLIKAEFPEISDSFNWAGVRTMVNPSSPKADQPYLFDTPLSAMNRRSLNLGMELTNTLNISETESTPKLDAVRSIEKTSKNKPSSSEWTEAIRLCLSISQSSSPPLIVQTLLESTLMFLGVDFGAVVLNFETEEPVIKAIGTNNSIFHMEDELLVTRTDLVPYKLVVKCLITGEITCREQSDLQEEAEEDVYYIQNPNASGICIPIKTSTVVGAIYLESHTHANTPKLQLPLTDSTKIDLLYLLCSQAAVSLSKSVVYTQMELAKKAAEEATEEKASFLANMSHEIRTPFNSLFACSIFLLDTSLTRVQKEYVETIKDSALVTLNIIDGILAFTKIEHGSFTLENEKFSINDTMEGAILFSSEKTEAQGFEFAYFNKCPQIDTIRGDPTRIRQIIINLVGNALKFTSKGYVKVILDAKPLTERRYQISITVEDTGIGIPEHSRTKVFGAFAQVDGSSRRVYGGSGLGLAISNKLAEIMNGSITFTSEEGIGSVFCFTCPLDVTLNEMPPQMERRDVCIVSQTYWKPLALREVLEYYGASVAIYETFEGLLEDSRESEILIIDKSSLTENVRLKSSLNWKDSQVYVLARFGQTLSDEKLKEIEADSMIFAPVKRNSIKDLLDREHDWDSLSEKVSRRILKTIDGTRESIDNVADVFRSMTGSTTLLKILIAEDNPVNLRVALQHLKKLGFTADHAKDGIEVLEKCEEKLTVKEKYDVIFMDIQMPRKDGLQAATELRTSFTERGLEVYLPQIIALTANVAGEERERCLACGMTDFVTKPILPEKLKSALLKVIENMK